MRGFIEGGRELYLNARPSGRDCGTVHVNPSTPHVDSQTKNMQIEIIIESAIPKMA